MKKLTYLLVIIFSISLFSCSVNIEKRRYRKGYYVNVIQSKHRDVAKVNKNNPVLGEKNSLVKDAVVQNTETQNLKLIRVNIVTKTPPGEGWDKINKPQNKKVQRVQSSPELLITNHQLPNKADCDVITLKDGTEIEAFIVKITDTEIEYKKCDYPEGPSYFVKTSEVLLIKLKNGENYVPKNNSNDSNNKKGSPLFNIMSIGFSFIGLIFSFLWRLLFFFSGGGGTLILSIFFLIAAIVFGAIGIAKQRLLMGFGIVGLTIGIVRLAILIAFQY